MERWVIVTKGLGTGISLIATRVILRHWSEYTGRTLWLVELPLIVSLEAIFEADPTVVSVEHARSHQSHQSAA